MFDFVRRRRWYYLFSGFLILISLVAMGISIVTYPQRSPVRLSIDFLGGSLFELQFQPTPNEQVKGEITESLLITSFAQFTENDVRVQRLGEVEVTQSNRWQVRTGFMDDETTERLKTALDEAVNALGLRLDRETLRTNQVSPAVGTEVGQAAAVAILVASGFVVGFIMIAFRRVPHALRYGVCAIIAMIHDIVILVGAMSILGLLLGWEADTLFLTAMLTVVAYSVQDSIVVFDRIRENTARRAGEPYELIVTRSIVETVQRSIMTQIIIGFVLVSLILMGGPTIRVFPAVLLIGLISGTYSSLFIGVPLLVSWEYGELPLVNRRAVAQRQAEVRT